MPVFEQDDQPLVSIVTPVFNGSQYVEQLIKSALEQDYPRIEHIVIDDGSSDGGATVQILERYPHLRWWTRENKGQYATLNEGLRAASGEVFTTISADDWYHSPRAISALVDLWRKRPHYDGVCGRILRVDQSGKRLAGQVTGLRWPRWVIYYANYLPHCAALIDRSRLISRNVVFDETLRYCGDMDWAIQLYRKKFRIYFTSQLVANYRLHQSQMIQSQGGIPAAEERARLAENYHLNPFVRALVTCACKWRFRVSYLRDYACQSGLLGVFPEVRRRLSTRWGSRLKDL